MEAIITAIIGAVVGITGGYFAFSTKKVEAEKEIKLAELENKTECNAGQCKERSYFENLINEEKKKFDAKEEELEKLLKGYAKNWLIAEETIKKQQTQIERLEKRIESLEEQSKICEKQREEWQAKEKELYNKILLLEKKM